MKCSQMPYKRVDFEEVIKSFQRLMKAFKNAESGEEQFRIHQEYYALVDHVNTMITIAHIRHDGDISDTFYNEEQEYYDKESPAYSNQVIEYQKLLFDSPYRDELENRIGQVAFKNMEIARKAMDERLIPLIQEENRLATTYSKLLAGAKIEWEGDVLNLSLLKSYMKMPDRTVRKKAWNKYSGFFMENEKVLDDLYDKLVKNRTEQARKIGYDNFLELGYYRMKRNCYGCEQIEHFREQVKRDFVPFVEKIHQKRRERLGIDKLSYIDDSVFFKDGNPLPVGTAEDILEAGKKMYSELSPETKEFYTFMQENELFDVLGRKNKRVGGYMTYIPDYHAPFIFANFNATSSDVDVITHECGHAFQGYLSGQDPIREHSDITMETAECHSMSMEFFTNPWMKLFFGERADDFCLMQLETAIIFIPYGCMVDEFQHIVYSNPELTPAERKIKWKELEKQYRPSLDYEEDLFFGNGGFWQQQHHIYNVPFYYIDYVIAQTVAFQYKLRMEENFSDAWKSYLKLCRLSAADFFDHMIRDVGIRIPFEEGYMKEIAKRLEEKLMKED